MRNGSVPLARPSKLPWRAYRVIRSTKQPRSPVRSGCSSALDAASLTAAASLNALASLVSPNLSSELPLQVASILLRSPEPLLLLLLSSAESPAHAGSCSIHTSLLRLLNTHILIRDLAAMCSHSYSHSGAAAAAAAAGPPPLLLHAGPNQTMTASQKSRGNDSESRRKQKEEACPR